MVTETVKFDPDRWVDTYGDRLYRFALLRLQDPEAARNAVQETFLAALSSSKKFSGKSSEYTWLTGILKHKIIDHIRKAQRDRFVTTQDEEDPSFEKLFDKVGHWIKPPNAWMDPAKVLEKSEFWKTFQSCLENLPRHLSQAFSLKELEGTDSRDICKLLEITPTNLWVILHRARLKLRNCLEINWIEKEEAK